MTTSEFKKKLQAFRSSFTSHLYFNLESPARMQGEIKQALDFLSSTEAEGLLKERIQSSVDYLNKASQSAKAFGASLKIDPKGYDLEASHDNPSYWYQKVIGTAESAIDIIVHYLDGKE